MKATWYYFSILFMFKRSIYFIQHQHKMIRKISHNYATLIKSNKYPINFSGKTIIPKILFITNQYNIEISTFYLLQTIEHNTTNTKHNPNWSLFSLTFHAIFFSFSFLILIRSLLLSVSIGVKVNTKYSHKCKAYWIKNLFDFMLNLQSLFPLSSHFKLIQIGKIFKWKYFFFNCYCWKMILTYFWSKNLIDQNNKIMFDWLIKCF